MSKELILKKERIEVRSRVAQTYSSSIATDVYRGLTASQKYIPSKYFYDDRGSRLFDEICYLPEYYPTRTEMSILDSVASEIMAPFGEGDIVELGSGANRKIRVLLDAVGPERISSFRYVPVDVSEAALIASSKELLELYPDLEVLGIIADFTVHLKDLPSDRPRMIIFLGSTIGNFHERERKKFLSLVAETMTPDDRFLIGFDMIKQKKTLEAAYNDSQGLTSAFNKNVLHVLNRELKADFNPTEFKHVAFFNEEMERVEMHLQAKEDMEIRVKDLDLTIELEKDETIHTEICAKFSREGIKRMAADLGLEIRRWFFDEKAWFSLAELVLKD